MLNEEIVGYMLQNAYKKTAFKDREPKVVKTEISQAEALEIFNEIVDVYRKHNVSYQCACRLSLALNEAMLSGAVEMYQQETNPYRDSI